MNLTIKKIIALVIAVIISGIAALLANSQLGMNTIFLIPLIVAILFIVTDVELSSYLVIFTLFSGIFWGLEIAGGFFIITAIFIFAWLIQKFFEPEPRIFIENTFFLILIYLFFLLLSILDARWPTASYGILLIYAKKSSR